MTLLPIFYQFLWEREMGEKGMVEENNVDTLIQENIHFSILPRNQTFNSYNL